MNGFRSRAQAPKHLDLYGVMWIVGVVTLFYYHATALAWLLLVVGPLAFAVRNYRINKPYMDAEKAAAQAQAGAAEDLKIRKRKYDSACLDVKWAVYRREITNEEGLAQIAAIGDNWAIPSHKRVCDLTIYATRTDDNGRVTLVPWETIDPDRRNK
jgi:hypothetical protein